MKVCALLYMFIFITFAAEKNSRCITPNKENGICIPVNSCSPIKQAIAYFDKDAIAFAKKSQCGYENSPLVCCGSVGEFMDKPMTTVLVPSSSPATISCAAGNKRLCKNREASKINSQCVTPNQENGICIPVTACQPIIDAMSYFDEDAINFAKKSQCGYETRPLVCCGSVGRPKIIPTPPLITTTKPPPPTTKTTINLKRNSQCLTPSKESGTCISIYSCGSILQSIAYYEQDAIEFAQKSQCGYDNGPLVCCVNAKNNPAPTAHQTIILIPVATKENNIHCITPNKENGTCIPVNSCKPIIQAITYFDHDAIEFARKSQCGYENGPLVCCGSDGRIIKSNGSQTSPPPIIDKPSRTTPILPTNNINNNNSDCITPNGENGTCIPVNSCTPIKEAIAYLEEDAINFAQKSQCGYNENTPLVCCGSVGRVINSRFAELNLPPNPLSIAVECTEGNCKNNSQCVTPNGENATCIPINSCKPIKQAITYFEENAIDFARNSQCGYEDTPLVCCGSFGKFMTPTTTSPSPTPITKVSNNENSTTKTKDNEKENNNNNNKTWFEKLVESTTGCKESLYVCFYARVAKYTGWLFT